MLRLFVPYISIFLFFLCFGWGRGSSRVMWFCPISSEIVVRQVCSPWTKSLNVVWPNVTWFLTTSHVAPLIRAVFWRRTESGRLWKSTVNTVNVTAAWEGESKVDQNSCSYSTFYITNIWQTIYKIEKDKERSLTLALILPSINSSVLRSSSFWALVLFNSVLHFLTAVKFRFLRKYPFLTPSTTSMIRKNCNFQNWM